MAALVIPLVVALRLMMIRLVVAADAAELLRFVARSGPPRAPMG